MCAGWLGERGIKATDVKSVEDVSPAADPEPGAARITLGSKTVATQALQKLNGAASNGRAVRAAYDKSGLKLHASQAKHRCRLSVYEELELRRHDPEEAPRQTRNAQPATSSSCPSSAARSGRRRASTAACARVGGDMGYV